MASFTYSFGTVRSWVRGRVGGEGYLIFLFSDSNMLRLQTSFFIPFSLFYFIFWGVFYFRCETNSCGFKRIVSRAIN